MRHGGPRGNSRFRAVAVLALASAALSLPLAAVADDSDQDAFVESSLAAAAERNPDALIRVIVQGGDGTDTARVADEVSDRLDD